MELPGGKRIRSVVPWLAWCILASSLIAAATGQSIAPAGARETALSATNGSVHIYRQIRDSHNGARWLVVSNPARPGGPGRTILENEALAGEAPPAAKNVAAIHRGDTVVLEEHTATADVRLQAIAMEAAAIGSQMKVRLKIGGKVVSAMAIAPGRAALPHWGEAQP